MSKRISANQTKASQTDPSNEETKFLRAIGRHIASYRVLRGLTQQELADKVQLSRTYIGHIELGLGNPHALTLRRLAIALDVSVGEFFKPL